MSNTYEHFNIFNHDENSKFTPGKQLANIAAVKPNETALIYVSNENVESVMTWHELETYSNRIAWFLMDKGIGPGSSVIVALTNTITHIALAFGIWKTGACYAPISNRTPKRNMMEICKCIEPSLVVTNRNQPAGYESLTSTEIKELSSGYSNEMPPDIEAIPNIANCSGGTSGKTKVIQQNIPAGESDEGLKTWFHNSGMRFEMRQLLAGPLFHGAPHSVAFNGLYCGNTLIMPANLKADNIVKLIKDYKIEYVQMVPTLMQRIIHVPDFKKEDFSSVEALCHTGGMCSSDLKKKWLEIIAPEKLYEIYSMTECVGLTSIRGDEWLEHPGSVGTMANGYISIRDEEGKELPNGQVGEIFMSWGEFSPNVVYKNIPNIEADDKGFKSVGDMGYLDADGYLYFTDIRSDMIVSGGENIFAAEVETVLKKHEKVIDAVIVGLPDKEWGRRIHAIVEAKSPVTDKELIKFSLNYLPPYKIPKSFEFVDEIPRNESGKLLRHEMLENAIKKGY